MTVRLYDSRAQELLDFEPLEPGRVGIYVCGPTVQSSPHIGHLRSALVYDLWRRWLTWRGFDVTLVRNVTDIDDKILDNATAGEEWWALAYRYELEFTAGYRAIGVLPPTYEPRATASVGQMQEIIQRLIDRGHAYPAEDGSGDVYFDVRSWPSYGELTRQSLDDMAPATDADPRGKRDARDFALWKGHKAEEPESASWPSPWGAGRPGWHIECSAMSSRYLGTSFDIHGGGLDLRFPHHENELAQSSAAGDGFARYWVHNGLVNVNGQKMSKSLGNSLFASDMLGMARPLVVRYYLGSAHYRSTIDYHDGVLIEAEAALERIEGFLRRAERRISGTRFTSEVVLDVPDAFAEAMDDDLSVPQALAVVHDTVRAGNAALDGEDLASAARANGAVLAMTDILGINPLAAEWQGQANEPAVNALGALVTRLLDDRRIARESKDFAAADRIRDELTAAGIQIEDTPEGSHWSLAGSPTEQQ
ncbi:cysteine--tRNA ligase [Salinibacterium sp. SYSU T00001]|uniref:cysteine--tRNA ligase n=1 Tax=Homoserinimonas sedimenticola TaxID=2986805 RepID=UPI0022354E4A|nr:cysteine--tRNA ligase [Salinibacterium sedimenticola]MCW4386134.1 cysteine--tRNA ligase [Salinibacterium sedimenticola]